MSPPLGVIVTLGILLSPWAIAQNGATCASIANCPDEFPARLQVDVVGNDTAILQWEVPAAPYSCQLLRGAIVLRNNSELRSADTYSENIATTTSYQLRCTQPQDSGELVVASLADATVAKLEAKEVISYPQWLKGIEERVFCDSFETCPVFVKPALTVSPTVVTSGQTVVFDWTLPDPTFVCELRRGTNVLMTDGELYAFDSLSHQPTVNGEYLLTCSRSRGGVIQQTSASTSVTVTAPAGLTDCPGPSPAGLFQNTNFTTWESMFGTWSQAGTGRTINLRRIEYLNLRFTVPTTANDFTRASLKWVGTPSEASQMRVAVQECIGAPAAERALGGSNCYIHKGPPTGNFSIGIAGNSNTLCLVRPGRTYVLSVSQQFSDGRLSCDHPSGACAWQVEEE